MKRLAAVLGILLIALFLYRLGHVSNLGSLTSRIVNQSGKQLTDDISTNTVFDEESTITRVVEKALPGVVTIEIHTTTQTQDQITLDPFNPFGGFRRIPGESRDIEQNIGSGFIVTKDGLIITNKHVVSDTQATYQVIASDDKKYAVDKIYRDPLNDLAILKIKAESLQALTLGDSSKLKLGQTAVAIGTPLGEFTNTVTSGIVSGLGRGITAGSPYEGYVERLDNVIQTDAAISPGNSGGPLLNSAGQVIGVNTAVSSQGQNIGFAIPSNVVRELIDGFNKRGGTFERPYLGVRYKMLSKNLAVQNDVVEGAYVVEVIPESPAAKAGLQANDIITSFDGKKVSGDDEQTLAKQIIEKKVGEQVALEYWRSGKSQTATVTLEKSDE